MSTQFDREIGPNEWERSCFAMSVDELEVHEAVVAMERLLDGSHIGPVARRALRFAINALKPCRPRGD